MLFNLCKEIVKPKCLRAALSKSTCSFEVSILGDILKDSMSLGSDDGDDKDMGRSIMRSNIPKDYSENIRLEYTSGKFSAQTVAT